MRCVLCKKEVYLPYCCSYCGQYFCGEHRLPEQHLCPGLPESSWHGRKEVYDEIRLESARRQIREKERVHRRTNRKKGVKVGRPSGHKKMRQYSSRGGYKKRRKLKLFVKTLLVVLLLCGGFVAAWKGGIFPEEINQKFETIAVKLSTTTNAMMNMSITEILDTVFIRLQGLPSSATKLVPTEDSPEPDPEPLKPFVSVNDLIRFLDNDNVSDVVYASDFKCGDFAEALVDRARNAGYDLKVYSMFGLELDGFIRHVESLEYVKVEGGVTTTITFRYGLGVGHAICKTKIGSETYLIEPQDDQIHRIVGSGYEIVYFGEVTKEN